jgi:hypothetical protein
VSVLAQFCRPDLTTEEREQVLANLMREIAALWQTDELRRQRPTPVDGEGRPELLVLAAGDGHMLQPPPLLMRGGGDTWQLLFFQLLAVASRLYRLCWLSWVAVVSQEAPGTADAADVGYAFGCIAMVSVCVSMHTATIAMQPKAYPTSCAHAHTCWHVGECAMLASPCHCTAGPNPPPPPPPTASVTSCPPSFCAAAEARGGLHVVEQSLWAAVPDFLRRLSTALKKHTGRELPLRATPIKFGSWMGGDRDGNPNVTAKTTHHVVALSRCVQNRGQQHANVLT